MRIDSVRSNWFRSIRAAALDDCGDLNVLIGKNNSGKSNLLTSINMFFDFFTAEGIVATVADSVRKPHDWHLQDSSKPIEISVTLRLTDDELDELKESIASETPQVRNALAGAELNNLTTIDLVFLPGEPIVAYISLIKFGNATSIDGVIYSSGKESAVEIAQRAATLNQHAEELQVLERARELDDEDWRRIKDRGYAPSSARIPETLVKHIRSTVSFTEFRSFANDQYQTLTAQVEELSGAPYNNPISTFSGSATMVPDYVTSFVGKVSRLNVHNLSEQRAPIGQAEAGRILKLKTSRGQGAVLQAIQDVVSSLLGVQIDAFSADDPQPLKRAVGIRRGEAVAAELDVDDFLVQMNGSGIREALRLILDREFERPDVLLVEEPEVHLHPALEIALMQYLKSVSSECQIFLTTHSTNFLDVGALRNIYLIRKAVETSVQHMNLDDAESTIPEELGMRLSSLFMYDRLAFVEGPSDEQILRLFAATLGVSFGQAALGFITTGGARNFTHYATTSTLSFLRKRNVQTMFILDRDERNDADVENLKMRVSGLSEVKVLERREMENYLLAPSSLARYISLKSNGAHNPTAAEIEGAISAACDDLFNTAVERRVLKQACRPVIPNREQVLKRDDENFVESVAAQISASIRKLEETASGIASLIAEVESDLRKDWEVNKAHLVPGDELLNSVFRKYGLTFSKKRDAVDLAASMQANDIPQEMKSLIGALVGE